MTNESAPAPNHERDTTTAPPMTKHGGHGWMMMICCVPMVAIAIALVAAGAVSPSFLFAAGACVAMMAVMMRGMDHGGGHNHT